MDQLSLRLILAVLLAFGSTVSHAAEPCRGDCLDRAEELLLAPSERPLHELFRSARDLAARACLDKDEAACALERRLSSALVEFDEASKASGPEAATRVLSARECIAVLGRNDSLEDWSTRVTAWCATALDACGPGLMLIAGHATPATRTELIAGICAEKICMGGVKPQVCSAPPGKAKSALGLLSAALKNEFPAAVADALTAAFEKPRHPFFADAAPSPKSKVKR